MKNAIFFLAAATAFTCWPQEHNTERDRKELEHLEQVWLHSGDAATLERILSPEFVHPVAQGVFLTKKDQVEWARRHPPDPNREARFDRLQVRLYGNIGIVNGVVVASGGDHREERTLFTDVFVFQDGRWQAINAQENAVAPQPR